MERFFLKQLVCILALFLLFLPVHAQAADDAFNPFDCQLTPELHPDQLHLGEFRTNNNLRRRTGAGVVADGIYTEIQGQVLDRFCVPVANAVIQLWQTDSSGHYQEFYVKRSAWDIVDKHFDPNFGYTGTARTDNMGNFTFLTIFPGFYGQKAPHLNVTVSHDGFATLSTQLFFEHHPRNATDPELSQLSPAKQQLLMLQGQPLSLDYSEQGRRYTIRITLDGVDKYQRY